MRKVISIAMAILLIISCCACKANKTENTSNSNSSSQNSSAVILPESSSDNSFVDDSFSSNPSVEDTVSDGINSSDNLSNDSSNVVTSDSSAITNSSSTSSSDASNVESSNSSVITNSSSTSSSDASNVESSNSSVITNSSNISSSGDDSDTSSDSQQSNGSTIQTTSEIPGSVTLGDLPTVESFITIDDDYSNIEILPEYGTAPSTLDTAWESSATVKKGNSDKEADKLRNEILSAKNTADIYDITGTTYYVSPNGDDNNDGKSPETAFKTTDAQIFRRKLLQPGDAVLFERGGLWRLTSSIKCKEGVIYGSYGKGEKPTFYGSAYNYADSSLWIPSNKKNIWKVSIADVDIGLVVLNHGELVGVKKLNGLIALEKNGDFYFNKNKDLLYFYYDGGNPGKVFDSIEIGLRKNLFTVSATPNVTIDNLRIKYTGAFGVSACGCDGLVVTNCEFGFIGGALQTGTIRYGNAIQVWNGVKNHKVENCWIYQIYDSGITFQGDYGWTGAVNMSDEYKNITYNKNLIEYTTLSIEFWHEASDGIVSPAIIENFNCTNNISRFAGYGWGKQRLDHAGFHLCIRDRYFPNAKNNKISGNIFDLADSYIVNWNFPNGSDMSAWNVTDNIYYHGENKLNEAVKFGSYSSAKNLSELQNAISIFDTKPKSIEWVD